MLHIFDADWTLRRCTVPGQPCPNRAGEWELMPGVKERLARLDWNTHTLAIASNQGGVGLGHLSGVTAHGLLRDLYIELIGKEPNPDHIQVCPHRPDEGCKCRKPRPAMLTHLMQVTRTPPGLTLFVGDQESDLQAAIAAGCGFAWAAAFFGWPPKQPLSF